jgi:hypothetical protein
MDAPWTIVLHIWLVLSSFTTRPLFLPARTESALIYYLRYAILSLTLVMGALL